MSSRTKSRKRAIDAIFAADVRDSKPLEMLQETRLQNIDRQNQAEIFAYATEIVVGVAAHIDEIDAYLEAYSQGWTLERMPALDRTIMRVAVWEIIYNDEVPDGAAIDEAVEIAKEYSTDDSPSFINGLLHKVSSTKRAL
ncbi:MAG: transcription antitermination factor NusB [Microbacteriaceae bacterium]|nr:transcription antitermination factor NusB [Microbacteriaceae bacterium]